MSVEGFLLHRNKCKTKHNIFQLVSDDEHFDFDIAVSLLKVVGDKVKDADELWTIVPPGYRWELVK